MANKCMRMLCFFLIFYIHLIFFFTFSVNLQEFDLKKPLKIKYVGGGEQGLDMGGLQKEFFHMIVEAVFDPGRYCTFFFL